MLDLVVSVALAASSTGAGVGVPPAPTLIWRDLPGASQAYVRGLTRQGTAVSVTVNGAAIPGLRYGAARHGVASFAAPWPASLEPGVYDVTAIARRDDVASSDSLHLRLVVPGLWLAPPRLA